MEDRHLFPGDGNDFSSCRKNWNGQFEDPTTAAQAAAESAENGKHTARATAELSRQYAHQNHTTKFACQPPREPVELPFRRIVSKWQIDILKGSHLNLGSLTF
ncbi:hypothetical protein Prudu_020453 [Prunus dulcis]|uniref:Uncharacterized protein n=1 Tax=Prunus dulcis TaxID=3755 RepID=A0A4Y1RWG3_PRUDU|nr:hypothetical protein Prudu_020453 [Prunus dulcis]